MRGSADLHVALSEILLEHDDLDGARRHLEESSALGAGAGLPQHPYRWRAATAGLRRADGDLAGAIELLDDAERVVNTDFSPAVRPIAARRARIQIADGDVGAARRWATERGLTPDDELTYVREYEHVTLARTLLAEGAVADALELLTRLLAAAEAGARAGTAIEVLVLLALAHHAEGDDATAVRSLGEALVRGEPEGYVRVFLDERPALDPLLRHADLDGTAADVARRLLDAGPTEASPTDAGSTARRRSEQPGARRAGAPAHRPQRARHRPRAVRVAQHPADPHQEHLLQARRRQSARGGAPRRRARHLGDRTRQSPRRSPHLAMCTHPVRPYGPFVTTDDRTPDPHRGAPTADHGTTQHYEIRVRGHLGSRWATWFDGLELSHEDDGTTVISGPVTDQAALHGLIQKLRDVGLPLISLVPVPTHPRGTSR